VGCIVSRQPSLACRTSPPPPTCNFWLRPCRALLLIHSLTLVCCCFIALRRAAGYAIPSPSACLCVCVSHQYKQKLWTFCGCTEQVRFKAPVNALSVISGYGSFQSIICSGTEIKPELETKASSHAGQCIPAGSSVSQKIAAPSSDENENYVVLLKEQSLVKQVCAAEMAVRYAALCASRKVHT